MPYHLLIVALLVILLRSKMFSSLLEYVVGMVLNAIEPHSSDIYQEYKDVGNLIASAKTPLQMANVAIRIELFKKANIHHLETEMYYNRLLEMHRGKRLKMSVQAAN